MVENLNLILSVAVKSLISALVLFVLARLMGKKQISQLTTFDYIVSISIGSIAAAASVDRQISVINGIVSMAVWSAVPVLFSFLSMHSIAARRLLDGTPVILVQNGKIIEKNLKKSKFTINDLLEELRIKDIFNISIVDCAVLETNGKLSVLKNSAVPAEKQSREICANIIIDGKIMKENMKQINIDEKWLNNELLKSNIYSAEEVLLAVCDSDHKLHIDRKNSDPEGLTAFQ